MGGTEEREGRVCLEWEPTEKRKKDLFEETQEPKGAVSWNSDLRRLKLGEG